MIFPFTCETHNAERRLFLVVGVVEVSQSGQGLTSCCAKISFLSSRFLCRSRSETFSGGGGFLPLHPFSRQLDSPAPPEEEAWVVFWVPAKLSLYALSSSKLRQEEKSFSRLRYALMSFSMATRRAPHEMRLVISRDSAC